MARGPKTAALDDLLQNGATFAGPEPGDAVNDPRFHEHDAKMAVAEVLEVVPPEHVDQPEPPQPREPHAPPVKAWSPPEGWLSMLDPPPPEDGKPIWLMGDDGQVCEAVHRHSRAYNPKVYRWEHVGFWALRNSGGMRVQFVPTCWRPAI